MLTYWAFKAVQSLIETLPRAWAYALGIVVARLAYRFSDAARERLETNLRQALPHAGDDDIQRIARLNFRNHSKAYADLMQLPALDLEQMRPYLHLYGMEHLDAALERGRGVLVISVHMGSWEIVAAIWAASIAPVYFFAEVLEPRKMYEWYRDTRAKLGIKVLPANRKGLKQVIEALESNAMVVTAIDRDVIGTGIPMRFFGRDARIPSGPAALALRLGTPLLPVCVYRLPDDSYQAVGLPPLIAEPSGDRDADLKRVTADLLHTLEDFVRQHPDQWHVPHVIWDSNGRGPAT